MKVPLSRPDVSEDDRRAVLGVLSGPHLALGPKLAEFEQAIARMAGTSYGIGVSSGTSGLHVALLALGIVPGDEVITTPFSFIASSNAILYTGALPVFVDVEPETFALDPDRVEAGVTPRTRAILVVDPFGHPAELDRIRDIAQRHHLKVVEDACEALGSEWKGVPCGNGRYADVAVFAFYPNKQITTGEGGCVVTDDPEVDKLCRSLRNQGRGEMGVWLDHERLGYNYRLDEMSAALGLSQLRRLDEFIAARQRVAERYQQLLKPLEDAGWLRLPKVRPEVTRLSWFVYVVHVAPPIDRDAVLVGLRERGVECRPYFTPIHLQPFYRQRFGYHEGAFPVTEAAGRTGIALPFFNRITEEEQEYVAETLRALLRDQTRKGGGRGER